MALLLLGFASWPASFSLHTEFTDDNMDNDDVDDNDDMDDDDDNMDRSDLDQSSITNCPREFVTDNS